MKYSILHQFVDIEIVIREDNPIPMMPNAPSYGYLPTLPPDPRQPARGMLEEMVSRILREMSHSIYPRQRFPP